MPIHRDAQRDLKTENGVVVMGHSKKDKKIENKEKKIRIKDAQEWVSQGYC